MAKAPKARRYAVALFELAGAQGKEEAWLHELRDASDALGHPDLAHFFSEPRVPAERKQEAIRQLASSVDRFVVNLLGLLVDRQAAALLPAIVLEYSALLNEHLGRLNAEVTSAVPVTPEQIERLSRALAEMLEQDVLLDVVEDPSIIGGMVVRVGDRIIDGSVRTRLESLRRRLERGSLF